MANLLLQYVIVTTPARSFHSGNDVTLCSVSTSKQEHLCSEMRLQVLDQVLNFLLCVYFNNHWFEEVLYFSIDILEFYRKYLSQYFCLIFFFKLKTSELEEIGDNVMMIISDLIVVIDLIKISNLLFICVDMNRCMNVELMFGWCLYKMTLWWSTIT